MLGYTLVLLFWLVSLMFVTNSARTQIFVYGLSIDTMYFCYGMSITPLKLLFFSIAKYIRKSFLLLWYTCKKLPLYRDLAANICCLVKYLRVHSFDGEPGWGHNIIIMATLVVLIVHLSQHNEVSTCFLKYIHSVQSMCNIFMTDKGKKI